MLPTIIVNKHTPYAEQVFGSIGNVIGLASSEFTREAVMHAEALIVRSETRVSQKLLEGTSVRFVGTVTVGTDHVDLDYLRERNIGFAHAPGSNAQSVAEYILSALLTLAVRRNFSLREKTLGVVGVGHIGSKVVRIAESLGMRVMQYDPPLARKTKGTQFVTMEELLTADILTLHVPLTTTGPDRTYHMFDEHMLRSMKPGAILINSSRGSVVETKAVKKVLKENLLSDVVLDVWENEPTIDTDLLSAVSIGTPHIAGYSLDGKLNAVQMIYRELCGFLHRTPEVDVFDMVNADPLPAIDADGEDQTLERSVKRIIDPVYDIGIDDTSFRTISTLPERERPEYFSSLRSSYRIRRECSQYTVTLPASMKSAAEILRTIRFTVNCA